MVQQTNSYEMLSLLLPDFVKDKYDQFMGGKVYKEIQDEPVAILFCEILDFNKILIEQGPGVVQILDQVFKEFDKFCKQYGIQKIEVPFFLCFSNYIRLLVAVMSLVLASRLLKSIFPRVLLLTHLLEDSFIWLLIWFNSLPKRRFLRERT